VDQEEAPVDQEEAPVDQAEAPVDQEEAPVGEWCRVCKLKAQAEIKTGHIFSTCGWFRLPTGFFL